LVRHVHVWNGARLVIELLLLFGEALMNLLLALLDLCIVAILWRVRAGAFCVMVERWGGSDGGRPGWTRGDIPACVLVKKQ
jgi:hypothetical protein